MPSRIFLNSTSSKSKIYERNWTTFDQNNFPIDWDQALRIDSNDIDKSFKNFHDKFTSLLDLYEPNKKVSEIILTFWDKPSIQYKKQKSIFIKWN